MLGVKDYIDRVSQEASMGCVTEQAVTGDNDPEVDQVRYYRHYLYCDACGSFDLKARLTPNHAIISGAVKWLDRVVTVLIFLAYFLAALQVAYILIALFDGEFSFGPIIWVLVPVAVVLIGVTFVSTLLEGKVEMLGVRCQTCGKEYDQASSFFTDFQANPHNLSVEDIPRPTSQTYWVRGAYVNEIGDV